MRSGSPGRGRGIGRSGMKGPGWRAAAPWKASSRAVGSGTGAGPSISPSDARPVTLRGPIRAGRRPGTRLAWLDAFDGRTDLVVAPADGDGPPVVVTRRDAAWATAIAGHPTTSWCVAGGDGRLVAVARRPAVSVRLLTRDGRAFGARGLGARRGRVRDRTRRRVRRRDGAARRVAVAAYGSRTPTTRGTRRGRPTAAMLAWHEWDSARHAVGRVADHACATTTGRSCAGRATARRACSQPRFSPDGAARSRAIRDGRACAIDGDAAAARRAARARRADVGPGPALVRVVARRRRARVVPQRGGLRPARDRRRRAASRRASCRRAGTAASTGPTTASSCVRSGAVTPTAGRRARRRTVPARRAIARGPVGGFEATGLVEPRPVTWKSANATVHGLLWRPADERRPRRRCSCNVHGGPTGQALGRLEPARAVLRAARATRCCSRTTAARPATASTTGRRSTGTGVSATSPTSSAGHQARDQGRLVRPGARRADGRQRGRLHGAERGRARIPTSSPRSSRCIPSPTCSTSRRPRTASSRVTTRGSSDRCPTRATMYVATLADHARAPRSRAPVLLLHGNADKVVVPRAVGRVRRRRCERAGTPGRAARVRGRGPRLAARGRHVADELDRIDGVPHAARSHES